MPRILEIALFLIPFLGFAAWRLLFPSPAVPLWLVCGLTGLAAAMLLVLFWMRHSDATDANQAYVPAQLRDGRITPTQQVPRE